MRTARRCPCSLPHTHTLSPGLPHAPGGCSLGLWGVCILSRSQSCGPGLPWSLEVEGCRTNRQHQPTPGRSWGWGCLGSRALCWTTEPWEQRPGLPCGPPLAIPANLAVRLLRHWETGKNGKGLSPEVTPASPEHHYHHHGEGPQSSWHLTPGSPGWALQAEPLQELTP